MYILQIRIIKYSFANIKAGKIKKWGLYFHFFLKKVLLGLKHVKKLLIGSCMAKEKGLTF